MNGEKEGVKLSRCENNIHGHHPWPKYLGGPVKQELEKLPKDLHLAYHKGLDRKLPRQYGANYYQNRTPEQQAVDFQTFQEYTQSFDNTHGTHLWDAVVKAAVSE